MIDTQEKDGGRRFGLGEKVAEKRGQETGYLGPADGRITVPSRWQPNRAKGQS